MEWYGLIWINPFRPIPWDPNISIGLVFRRSLKILVAAVNLGGWQLSPPRSPAMASEMALNRKTPLIDSIWINETSLSLLLFPYLAMIVWMGNNQLPWSIPWTDHLVILFSHFPNPPHHHICGEPSWTHFKEHSTTTSAADQSSVPASCLFNFLSSWVEGVQVLRWLRFDVHRTQNVDRSRP